MIKSIEKFLINNKNIRALNIHSEHLGWYFRSLFWKYSLWQVHQPHSLIPDYENGQVYLKSSIRQPDQRNFFNNFFFFNHLSQIQLACLVLSPAVLKCSVLSFVCYSISRTYPWSYNIQPYHYRNNVHISNRYEFILCRSECRPAWHMKLSWHYVYQIHVQNWQQWSAAHERISKSFWTCHWEWEWQVWGIFKKFPHFYIFVGNGEGGSSSNWSCLRVLCD